MGSKRTKTQLTREQVYSGEQDNSEDDAISKPKLASKAKMSRRKIAHFKSRLPAGAGVHQFGFKLSSNPISNSSLSPSGSNDLAKATQLKSLNANFLQSINDAITKNAVADMRPIISKYTDYYTKVDTGKLSVRHPDTPKVIINPQIKDSNSSVFDFGDSKEHEKSKPIELEPKESPKEDGTKGSTSGPVFKIDKLPVSKDYNLKFGFVPPKDKDSDTKVEGPAFKVSPELQNKKNDSIFKMGTAKETKNSTKPLFTFKAPDKTKDEHKKPQFSFNTSSAKSTAETKPSLGFNFGSKVPAKIAPTPAFQFGSTNDKPAIPSFGKNNSAFNFGKKDETKKSETVSAFNFGSASKKSDSSKFDFGSSTKNASSNPFGKTDGSTFGFTFAPPKNTGTGKDTTAEIEGENAEDDKTKNNYTVVKLTKKVETKTGEEDEKAIFVKRTKLSKYDPTNKEKPYQTVGVGELKILVNEKDSKARILIRSDGLGNVLLNTQIVKGMKYKLMGSKNNILRIPAVTSDGKMAMYITQVKTGEDGKQLLEKVEKCQKSN